jgi:hypothetical protein
MNDILIHIRIIGYFKVSEGILLMEGEEEILKGTKTKYFELFPERSYKQGKSFL